MKALKLIPRMWILISLLFTIHNISAQNNIVGYEYAFNDGEGLQYVSISPTPDFNLNTNIDVSTLTNDVNVIHLRFQDDLGLWSSTVSKIFVKTPEVTATASSIVGYEYVFDNGNSPVYVPITPTADFNLVTDIDVSSLTNDVNVFHIRFLDDIGQWSSIVSKIFIKPPEASATASTIVGYEFGFNDGENIQYVPITPSADFNLITNIDVSSLVNDVNVFHIRFQDDIGQWSSFLSKIFVKPPETSATASNIVGYEYGFNDLESMQYVPISPTADFNLITDIDVNSLTNDVNILHIRFQDDIGQWSSMISKIFINPPEASATASNIVAYEYGFNDLESMQYVPITPSVDFNLVTDIDVSSLVNDVNIFHIRFQDDIGQWSSFTSKIFVKPPEVSATASDIVGYEYSFNDGENIQYVPITPSVDFNLVTDIDVSSLTNDVNTFHIRFLDDIGQWSSIISKIFVKPPQVEDLSGNMLTSLEYWFDNDTSNTFNVDINPEAIDYILAEVNLNHLWEGEHTLHTQFKDTAGKYSVVMTDTINKTLKPFAAFTADKISVCVGETISFTSTSVDYDIHNWDFDDMTTSSDINPTHAFTNPGSYNVNLYVEDSASGLNDSKIQQIDVYEIPSNSVSISTSLPACYGETVTLTADYSSGNYLWSNGATTRSIDVIADGTFSVEVSNQSNTSCASTSSDIVVSFTPEIDNTTTYTPTQDLISANQSGATYQWIDCDAGNTPIPGAINQDLTITEIGEYAVEITMNGCTEISDCINVVTLTNTEVDLEKLITIYPNPTNGILHIKSQIAITFEIYSIDGKRVNTGQLSNGLNTIDFSRFEGGMYFLRVIDNSNNRTTDFKIIKK